MIEHFPIEVHSVSELLSDIFVWLLFELMIWAAVLLSSERRWPLLAAALTRLEHGFNSLARHRVRVVAAIFVLVFAGRLALLPIVPVPPPRITDEFSQQLAADTFACGRVTNPTHPMSFYFETFYVNQKPSYHSMYPPATGLFMAAAQVLTGQSWYGMLFTIAAAAAAICWMLQGWVAPRWALWGAMLFVLLVAKNRMTEFYFGEGIVILGGALVLGAMPRIIKRHSVGASFCLGIGLALLAASRPYEGCLLAAGLCLGASVWAWKSGMRWPMLLRKVALPVAVILVPVFMWVAYLNWRTTGSPWLPPYELNLVQQHITRPLVWQKPVEPPHYDHPVMAAHYEQWEWNWWKSTQGFPRGVARFLADKGYAMYAWVLWPLALVTGVGSYQLLKSGIRRFLPLALFAFLAGLSIETYQLQGRYVATAWGLFLLLAVYGARYIGTWKRSTRQGSRIA
ncbi:MAG: hypothetical protein ABSD88_20595, partial [Candidatus Korobacteraceae bacterium]